MLEDRRRQGRRPDQGEAGPEEAVEGLGDVLPEIVRSTDHPDEQGEGEDRRQHHQSGLHAEQPVGKQLRSDQRVRPLAIAGGHDQRMADLAQDRLLFVLGQGAAQRLFLRLEPAQDQVAQFGGDVGAFVLRQLRGDGVQIAVDQVHGFPLQPGFQRILSSEALIPRHSSVSAASIETPPGDRT